MSEHDAEKTAKIFLSYERSDVDRVDDLFRKLTDAGYEPWMDKKSILPGTKWQDAIKKAVRKADLFLACISRQSVDKRGVLQKEIKYALDRLEEKLDEDIFLIPVRLEEVELPEVLADYQWVDLFEENGWSRLVCAIKSQGFPGVAKAPVRTEKRWNLLQDSRVRVRDLTSPVYLLDDNYHFLDWNPSFDELVAKPLGLRRGQHALAFINQLENCAEVMTRSQEVFGPDKDPLVDMEVLKLPSEKYGLIHFQKLAAQIADAHGNPRAWSVNLNILEAEKLAELWQDVHSRLEQEINWSRYSVSYDQLLLPFDEYQTLLETIVNLVGTARRCVDLGAGTGNATIKLLQTNRDRDVWAIDSSESMLSYLHAKVDEQVARGAIDAHHLAIIKEDILRLEELPHDFFDAAVLINVLYAVDDPQACLDQVRRVLKPGGILALSTSHSGTDVERLFARMRQNLEEQGKFEALKRNYEAAKHVHEKMIDRIHRDTKADIRDYIEKAGFEVAEWRDSEYVEAVVVVKAVKR